MQVSMRFIPLCALIALLFVALATSGFAHRFASPGEQAALVYAQTFGLDAEDICGGADMDAGKTCDACRLHAAMSLQEPSVTLILAELSLDPAEWTSPPPVLHDVAAVPLRPSRAPPVA